MSNWLQLDVRNISLGRRHLVNTYEVIAGIGVVAGKTVWSMPERLVRTTKWVLYKYTYVLPFMTMSATVGFNVPLDTLWITSGMILQVRKPDQQCHRTEGQWLVNQVKGQSHQAQLIKGKEKNVSKKINI